MRIFREGREKLKIGQQNEDEQCYTILLSEAARGGRGRGCGGGRRIDWQCGPRASAATATTSTASVAAFVAAFVAASAATPCARRTCHSQQQPPGAVAAHIEFCAHHSQWQLLFCHSPVDANSTRRRSCVAE